MAADLDTDFSTCSALVVDSNPNFRRLLATQLRDLGIRRVVQCSDTPEARRQLESQGFDFVLCEMYFPSGAASGQDFLDDLLRHQLLPFATVFIMVTGEATYPKVAEAAESALDSYLLKPLKGGQLAERLQMARTRKRSLRPIFDAINAEDFARAAQLCLERFNSRGPYWLYAARIGAELLLRLEKFQDAKSLFEEVVEAKKLPWAKLGIARAQLDAGQTGVAASKLERLIEEDPKFVYAYDVMGRAQFELGHFDKSLATYSTASSLTPASMTRLQNAALMTFYAGERPEAERLLDRTARLGLESKMFDGQTLVLLAFSCLDLNNGQGLRRCHEDIARLLSRYPLNTRIRRLMRFVEITHWIHLREWQRALAGTQALAAEVRDADFDYQSAGNLLALLVRLHMRQSPLPESEHMVENIALRFCSNRPVTELLTSSADDHPDYAQLIRGAQATMLQSAEAALTESLGGKPGYAVQSLLSHAAETLNVRLIDNAYRLILRHKAMIADYESLKDQALKLRGLAGAGNRKISLTHQMRLAGGMVLRATPREIRSRPAPQHEAISPQGSALRQFPY